MGLLPQDFLGRSRGSQLGEKDVCVCVYDNMIYIKLYSMIKSLIILGMYSPHSAWLA